MYQALVTILSLLQGKWETLSAKTKRGEQCDERFECVYPMQCIHGICAFPSLQSVSLYQQKTQPTNHHRTVLALEAGACRSATTFEQTRQNDIKHGKRHPSWCDRIVYAQPTGTVSSYFQPRLYTAIENEQIAQSDHDLVFSHFSYPLSFNTASNFNVLVSTWNIGGWHGYKQGVDSFQQIICSMKAKFNSEAKKQNGGFVGSWDDINLFHFAFQEVSTSAAKTGVSQKFVSPLRTALALTHTEQWQTVVNTAGDGLFGHNFCTLSIIFYNIQKLEFTLASQRNTQTLTFKSMKVMGMELASSKTALIVGPFVQRTLPDASVQAPGLYLAAAHLPIDNKDKDGLGYQLRVNAMNEIRDTWSKMPGADKYPLVLAGDLNFRKMSDNKREQLKEYISKEGTWHEIDVLEFQSTCKKQTKKQTKK